MALSASQMISGRREAWDPRQFLSEVRTSLLVKRMPTQAFLRPSMISLVTEKGVRKQM